MAYSLNLTLRTDKPNTNGLCPLYLRYTYNRKYYNIPTALTLSPTYWNDEDNVIRRNFTQKEEYNFTIDRIRSRVNNLIGDFLKIHNRFPEAAEMKDLHLSGVRKTLEQYFEDFVAYKRSKNTEEGSIKTYYTSWHKWQKYEEAIGKTHSVNDMTLSAFDNFKTYCMKNGIQINTIGMYIKTFKTFLNYLSLYLKVPIPADFAMVKKQTQAVEFEVLTQKELDTLKAETELTNREHEVKDMMLFMCNTGLSFSDFNKLTVSDIIINDDGCFIQLTRKKLKTVELCVIPVLRSTIFDICLRLGALYWHGGGGYGSLHSFAVGDFKEQIEILKQALKNIEKKGKVLYTHYPRLFPKITNQEFNETIKIVCRKAGIDTNVKQVKIINNKVIEETIPKYKRISSHTARRTYITLCLQQGIRMDYVMKTTGHKKLETLQRYTKITAGEVNNAFVELIQDKQDKAKAKKN